MISSWETRTNQNYDVLLRGKNNPRKKLQLSFSSKDKESQWSGFGVPLKFLILQRRQSYSRNYMKESGAVELFFKRNFL